MTSCSEIDESRKEGVGVSVVEEGFDNVFSHMHMFMTASCECNLVNKVPVMYCASHHSWLACLGLVPDRGL